MSEVSDLYRILKCMRCGECRSVCPVFQTTGIDTYSARGRMILVKGVIETRLDLSSRLLASIYSCTTCRACEVVCSAGVDVVDVIQNFRTVLTQKNIVLTEHKTFSDHIKKYGNPFGRSENRLEHVMNYKKSARPELVYFIGCMAGYKIPRIANSTIAILNEMGVDYMVSQNELCCGSPLLRVGRVEEARRLAESNLETISEGGANTVVFSCAGCYKTFKEDYKKLIGEFDLRMIHITELLMDYEISGDLNVKVTYHDPCHLGRHLDVFHPPREILKDAGANLIEMENIMNNSKCCGAGGGVRSAYKNLAIEIGKRRIYEALETGADILITSCPFCTYHLEECSDNILKVMDITEILGRGIEERQISVC